MDQKFKNWHEFAKACPLLSLCCIVVDWEGEPQVGPEKESELWFLIRTATDSRFEEAEAELTQLTTMQLREVIYAEPGTVLDSCPITCSVLTAMWE